MKYLAIMALSMATTALIRQLTEPKQRFGKWFDSKGVAWFVLFIPVYFILSRYMGWEFTAFEEGD
jgi:hypothetical protein